MDINTQVSHHSSNADGVIWIFVFFAVAMFGAILWAYAANQNFNDAQREFEGDPTNEAKKQRLIQAARAQGSRSNSALRVMQIVSEAEERERRRAGKKGDFTAQLATLSQLHQRGELSDVEFQKAKAKLLG